MSQSRENFKSRFAFILAASGAAIGLGNIYQFPFKAGEGGGAAFLILYLIFSVLFCFPVLISEIAIGRSAQKNSITAFKVLGFPKWSRLGKFGVIAGLFIFSYYIMIAAWTLSFLYDFIFSYERDFSTLVSNSSRVFLFAAIFMAATVYLVSKGIVNGIEKTVRYLMPALLFLLLLLITYALTLQGASKGLRFYLLPNLGDLFKLETIHSALSQAFFSLSLGMGAMITYGSYMKKSDNLLRSSLFIVIADLSIAFLAGLMIFPFVFSFDLDPSGGSQLLFVTMPKVFLSMGAGLGQFVGVAFFSLLCFAVLTSTISFLEVSVAYLSDEKKLSREKASLAIGLLVLIMSLAVILSFDPNSIFSEKFIPYFSGKSVNYFSFISDFFADFFLPFGGFLMVLFTAYRWKGFFAELEKGDEKADTKRFKSLISFTIRFLSPIFLGILVILTVLNKYFDINLI